MCYVHVRSEIKIFDLPNRMTPTHRIAPTNWQHDFCCGSEYSIVTIYAWCKKIIMLAYLWPSPPPPGREQLWDKSISHGFYDLQLCTLYLAWLKCLKVQSMRENAFCMVFRTTRLGRDSETRGEKNPQHISHVWWRWRGLWFYYWL